jgi:ABC-type phosphate transport system ATPase subunit
MDLVDIARIEGKISIEGKDIYQPGVDVAELRRHVGIDINDVAAINFLGLYTSRVNGF